MIPSSRTNDDDFHNPITVYLGALTQLYHRRRWHCRLNDGDELARQRYVSTGPFSAMLCRAIIDTSSITQQSYDADADRGFPLLQSQCTVLL